MNTELKPSSNHDPIYLHLELDTGYCSKDDMQILKKYADIKHGSTISREILVPEDMTIRALHYTIQRLFGWMGKYDYTMKLPDNIYDDITKEDPKRILELAGVLLKCPDGVEIDDEFFVSFDKTRPTDFENRFSEYYTGPYANFVSEEDYNTSNGDIESILDEIAGDNKSNDEASDYMSNNIFTGDPEKDEEIRINANKLLVRLKVSSVLAHEGYNISKGIDYLLNDTLSEYREIKKYDDNYEIQPNILPLTYKLIYEYDSNQKWRVNITMLKDFSVLVDDKGVSYDEIAKAKEKVLESYKPYCIFCDGANAMEDVANLPGFCKFLTIIYESKDSKERNTMLKYARRRDWHIDEISDPIVF